jgi:hypothetical protein
MFQLYNISKYHAIGTTLTVLFAPYSLYSDEGMLLIAPQFHYKITYKRKGIVTMYSSVAAGVQMGWWRFLTNKPEVFFWLAYQIDFFGISFGKKHNGFVELGWGNQGTLKVGYNYKF